MLDRAECMLARAGRQSGLLVGALFIDIDWFKDVNDKLGRGRRRPAAEDRRRTPRGRRARGRHGRPSRRRRVRDARRVRRSRRASGRTGTARDRGPAQARSSSTDFGPNFFLTASIGVAFGRYATPDDLLRDAQLALYAAKAAGKDRYTLFNANMRSVIEGRGVLEVELNAALAEKQFSLLYQPIYDLEHRQGRRPGGAACAGSTPRRAMLAPEDFIPLAEETGLIVPIGRWVLEEACSRAAAWNVAGHRVGISVKVSANQLNRDGFPTDVLRALQQSGIEPSLLTLEIAETTVMRDVAAAVARLEEIKRLGVRIAIDDFGGSGYAYHSDLRRLPLDFLKVDRSSLAASDDEDYRSWLLEAILIVGRDLSLTVIAKGIETYEQMTTLQDDGLHDGSGPVHGQAHSGGGRRESLRRRPPGGTQQLRESLAPAATLRVEGLAAREHRHEALDPSRAGVAALGVMDAVEHRVTVLAAERLEHRLGRGNRCQRRRKVVRHLDRALARVGDLPASIRLGPRHRGQARRMHPALRHQPLDEPDVALRPRAARAAGSEALAIGVPVTAPDLAVDPAVA